MLIDTVAIGESTVPSLTLNVKLSAPVALRLGVYVKLGAVPDKTPLVGDTTTAYVNALPSMSVPANVIVLAIFLITPTDWALATGVSLTAVILIVTVADGESTVPSLTLNVK